MCNDKGSYTCKAPMLFNINRRTNKSCGLEFIFHDTKKGLQTQRTVNILSFIVGPTDGRKLRDKSVWGNIKEHLNTFSNIFGLISPFKLKLY